MDYDDITCFSAYDYGVNGGMGVFENQRKTHTHTHTHREKMIFKHTNGASPSSKYPIRPNILQST